MNEQQPAEQPPTKAELYANALIETLALTAAAIGGPDINAALSALAFTQAYLVAKIEDRNERRHAMAMIDETLREHVTAMVNERVAGQMNGRQ